MRICVARGLLSSILLFVSLFLTLCHGGQGWDVITSTRMTIRWVDACDPSWGDPDIYVCVRPDGTQEQCTSTKDSDDTPTFNTGWTWGWEVNSFRFQVWDEDWDADDLRASNSYSQSSLFSSCSGTATSCESSKSMSNTEGCNDVVHYTIQVYGYNTPSPTTSPTERPTDAPTEPYYGLDICIYSDGISEDYEPFGGKWVRDARDSNGYNYWRQSRSGIVDDENDYYIFYDTTESRLYGTAVANLIPVGDVLFYCDISSNIDPTACDGNWYFATYTTYLNETFLEYTLYDEVNVESCYLASLETDCSNSSYHNNVVYTHVCLDNMKYQTHLLEGTYIYDGCNEGFPYYYNPNAHKFMYFSLSDGKYLISNNMSTYANGSDAYCPSTDIMDCNNYLYECDLDYASGECHYTLANDPLIDDCYREDICVYGKSLIDDEYESYAGRYKYNATNEHWQHVHDLSIILTRDSIVGVRTIPGDVTSSISLLCTDSGTTDATQCGNWSYYSTADTNEYNSPINVEFCNKLENDTDCSYSSEKFDEICIRHLTYQFDSIEGSYGNNSCVNGFQQFINTDTSSPSSVVFDLDYGRLSVLDSSLTEMGYCYSTSILDCDYDNFYEYSYDLNSSQWLFISTSPDTRIVNCGIPTKSPTTLPTHSPTDAPTPPTPKPTRMPTPPTPAPTKLPSSTTNAPTATPSNYPSESPTASTLAPTHNPTENPTGVPTIPSQAPTVTSIGTTQAPTVATTIISISTTDIEITTTDSGNGKSLLTAFVGNNTEGVIGVGAIIATICICGCFCACCVHFGMFQKHKRRKFVNPFKAQQNKMVDIASVRSVGSISGANSMGSMSDGSSQKKIGDIAKAAADSKANTSGEEEAAIDTAGNALPIKIATNGDTIAMDFIINGSKKDGNETDDDQEPNLGNDNCKATNSGAESDVGELVIVSDEE